MHFLNFYSYAMVALAFLKDFLETDHLELGKNKNTPSIFNIAFTLLIVMK